MIKYITYFNDTGEIQSWGNGLIEMLPLLSTDHVTAIAHNLDLTTHTHYVINGHIEPRPKMSLLTNKIELLADGIDSIRVVVPERCAIDVDNITYTCDDGEFEFATTSKGTYSLTFSKFPYMPTTLEVRAL